MSKLEDFALETRGKQNAGGTDRIDLARDLRAAAAVWTQPGLEELWVSICRILTVSLIVRFSKSDFCDVVALVVCHSRDKHTGRGGIGSLGRSGIHACAMY